MTTAKKNGAAQESAKQRHRDSAHRPRRVVSIRLIISLATVALTAISVIGFAWMAERNGREVLTGEIETRLLLEARSLASLSADALLNAYPELTLCPLVSEIQEDREDLAFATVLDHEGKIKGHDDLEQLGRDFTALADLVGESSRQALLADEKMLGNAELLVASVPVLHPNGRTLGRALVGLKKPYLDTMVAHLRDDFVLLTGLLLTAGIVTTLVLMSLLLRPVAVLRRGLERIGRGDLETPLLLKDRTEFGLLAESVNGMASRLLASQTEMLEKERLDHEMDLAHSMQQSLLPEGPVRHGDLVCAGSYKAATEVGGDFFDVFELPNGKLGVVVADVSGKGLRGCLVTSMLAVLIRSLAEKHDSPSLLLVALEESLSSYLAPGMFVTIFYGIMDAASDQMTFASAAHCPMLVHRARTAQTEWYKTKGIPLGAARGGFLVRSLVDEFLVLEPGDQMLLYTDGLNEAWHSARKEEFGFERIAKIVAQMAAGGHSAVLAALERSAHRWTAPDPLGDDLTLLVIERDQVTKAAGTAAGEDLGQSPTENHLTSAATLLYEMLADVHHLLIPADQSKLNQLRPWLEQCPDFLQFSKEDRVTVESGLYEVCANLIEHGYHDDTTQKIALWWLPTPPRQSTTSPESDAMGVFADGDDGSNEFGYFIICDQGKAYDPHQWIPPDMNDPAIRRRGRGLGLNIVHSSTRDVVYSPSTPAGNLTMLRFNSQSTRSKEESNHVESIRN